MFVTLRPVIFPRIVDLADQSIDPNQSIVGLAYSLTMMCRIKDHAETWYQSSAKCIPGLARQLSSLSVLGDSQESASIEPDEEAAGRIIRMKQNCSHLSISRRRSSKLQLRTRRRRVFSGLAIAHEAGF